MACSITQTMSSMLLGLFMRKDGHRFSVEMVVGVIVLVIVVMVDTAGGTTDMAVEADTAGGATDMVVEADMAEGVTDTVAVADTAGGATYTGVEADKAGGATDTGTIVGTALPEQIICVTSRPCAFFCI